MEEKYEILTDETKQFRGRTLYRIKATRDFGNVKEGDLGGWIEKEDNLSQYGNCWIYNNAVAMDNSRLEDDAKMYDYACICDNAIMYDYSEMYDDACMCDHSKMHDFSKMRDNAIMLGYSQMYDNSLLYDDAEMHDYSEMHDFTQMYNYSEMHNGAVLKNDAILKGKQKLYGYLYSKVDDFIEVRNPEGKLVTCVLKEGKILYNIGCQEEITEEEFKNRIYHTNGGLECNPHREYYLRIIKSADTLMRRVENE